MYRKFSADQVFDGYKFCRQQVLITDEAGVIVDLVDEHDAGEGIEKLNGILCPGFINAHCHLELSHMKGLIPKHTGLIDFVLKVMNERHFEETEILSAIERAEDKMLQSGIVAVGDICNNTLTISQKKKERLRYHNFIEASGFPPVIAEQRFKRALDFYNAYAAFFPASSIVPHAPYSVSPELFAMINGLPGNKLLTMHNQETEAENELFESGTGDFTRLYQQMGIDVSFFTPTGKSSLQSCLPYFTKEQSLILVHDVCTTEEDVEFVKVKTQNAKHKTYFCLCPNANLYITDALPDLKMLMQHECNIVLGTDSLASNDQLSILEEMKTLQKHFPDIELAMLLQWATSNGARALQINETLGSFEKGKKPGLLLIERAAGLKLTEKTISRRII